MLIPVEAGNIEYSTLRFGSRDTAGVYRHLVEIIPLGGVAAA